MTREAMNHLDALESQSIYILREAYHQLANPAMLWSVGKDSNVMIWLARKAFVGAVPFPVVHLDTGKEFAETYAFRDRYVAEWGLDLVGDACPPIEHVDASLPPASRFAARKSLGLTQALERYGYDGIIAGIRRDEQSTRAKERVFSPRGEDGAWDFRDQPPEFWDQFNARAPQGASGSGGGHVRVHPLLHWTERDIWLYIQRENIPVVPLYFARDGKRFRSLGEEGITFPIDSDAVTIDAIIAELDATTAPERQGRAMDHEAEDAFERLRESGYM
jgi:sulfate adenylyltransferase subunit 2